MGLAIFLRKRVSNNRFRSIIIDSINSGVGNRAIICSGFFQEDINKKSNFQVSMEGNLDQALLNRNIELTTIGAYNTSIRSYRLFCKNLRNKGIRVNSRRIKGFKWHAKIFILKKDNTPILGIVGSSNMTRSAFGLSEPFNIEADVIMWSEDYIEIRNIIGNLTESDSDFKDEVIITDYDPEKNFGLTIEERLNQLAQDLMQLGYVDLD